MSTREDAIGALVSLVAGAYAWRTGPSRRLKLWSDVPLANRPACFVFEGGQENYAWQITNIPKRTIEVKLFVYIDAKDPNVIGASALNNIMDALDAAFLPVGADSAIGRNTLGGRVSQCRIDGAPMKDPGDLDGDGLLIVPVKIIFP